MSASAEQISNSLEAVARLRAQRMGNEPLSAANAAIKRFQPQRFQATYADLLQSQPYQTSARFFLHELYSQQDNAERNQQLARIARAMAKLFPQWVVNTAAALAEVHALTERLDHAMARDYLALQPVSRSQSDAAPCMHAGGRWLTLLHASINSGLC